MQRIKNRCADNEIMTYAIKILSVFVSGKRSKVWRLPPSLNSRMHWAVKGKIKKQFQSDIFYQLKALKVPKCQKIKVTLINYTCYPMDRDNLFSCFKPLVDAIVLANIVPDDAEEFVDSYVKNVKVDHIIEQKVIMEIEPIIP